ncbi:MAG TPA: DUF547 domain-containing protein [Phycisphaerae bacterium]|nr:DUF547 domain-containing protein [Phycisphaerae bacterium]HRW52606.1 DUF547 domain-containing protein [Phycisphaerae bacterium]
MNETSPPNMACGPGCRKRKIAALTVVLVAAGVVVAQQLLMVQADGHEVATISHANWDGALQTHVNDEGRVDYAGISRDARFTKYLTQLKETKAAALPNINDRLAFWINAYNALTIRVVLDTLPEDKTAWPEYQIIEQKIDGKSVWKGRSFDVGGERRTLDEIEHEILRKREGLRDPRIHVALVCAARGCPRLWNRAFTGGKVREQLADAMRRFVNDPRQVSWDMSAKTIRASRILEWYGGDFTDPKFAPHATTIGRFLADYADDAAWAARLRDFRGKFAFYDYDWRLNVQVAGPAQAPSEG